MKPCIEGCVSGALVIIFDTLYSSRLGYLYLKLEDKYVILISFTLGIFSLEPHWGQTPPYKLMTSLGVGIPK